MLHTYLDQNNEPMWFDLYNPEEHEIRELEASLNVHIPTKEEMGEIEASSRLYEEDKTLFMTATLITSGDSENPNTSPVTFILQDKILVTVRYSDFKPFEKVVKKIEKNHSEFTHGQSVFLFLLDVIIARIADILEMIGLEIEDISKEIFKTKPSHANNHKELHEILLLIGKKGSLNSKCRESIESLSRLLTFFIGQSAIEFIKKIQSKIHILQRDLVSISDHVSFLFNKINFLLDATLGFINIEQNSIIKIFSVAAVIFLPPTLIASIYGMNFAKIPELDWMIGYPFALILMVISAVLPYLFFKRRGWL